jgi:hypothetical protein
MDNLKTLMEAAGSNMDCLLKVMVWLKDQGRHAIIRGSNGRRHEVDFGDSPVRVEVYASEETVEIFVEADSETLPEERRRFALINVPRDQFSHATGEAARRATRKDRYRRATSA